MINRPYWKNESTWVCPNHLPSAKIPASCATCWFSNCKSERPAQSNRPTKKPTPPKKSTRTTNLYFVNEKTFDPCYWKDCNKGRGGGVAESRERSKYCSTDCKNRNARWRYNMKKKGIKISAA